jgi:hypothetical protein
LRLVPPDGDAATGFTRTFANYSIREEDIMKRTGSLVLSLTLALALALAAVGCGSDKGTQGLAQQPEPPAELQADKFSDGEVLLRWSASPDEAVAGYTIYRSDDSERFFSKVGFVVDPSFRDIGLNYEKVYFYRVVAVNDDGLESEPLTLSGRPLNTLWPSRPRGLLAEARNLEMIGFEPEIELSWEASQEADLALYRVYGSTRPEFQANGATLLAEVVEPWYSQTGIEVGATYHYKVAAVDVGGLESPDPAVAAVELIAAPALNQPIRGIYAASEKPLFVWQANPLARPGSRVRYTVSLADGPAARELWVEQAQKGDGRLQYDGQKLEAGTYWWKVLVEVVDQDDRVESLALSELGHFRVR